MSDVDQVKDNSMRLPDLVQARLLHLRRSGEHAYFLFLHGTPGSRLKFSIAQEAGKELGSRHRCARPVGLRADEAPPAPSLRGFGDDMAGLMNKLGRRSFAAASRAADPMRRPRRRACSRG